MKPTPEAEPLRSYSPRQIASAAGVSLRTISVWRRSGLLATVPNRGPATRYSEAERARVIEIQRLRRGGLMLHEIRQRFADLEAQKAAAVQKAAPPPETKPPAPEPTTSGPAGPPATAGAGPIAPATTSCPGEAWQRVALLPGLELHVHAGGGPLVERIAREIWDRYAVRVGER